MMSRPTDRAGSASTSPPPEDDDDVVFVDDDEPAPEAPPAPPAARAQSEIAMVLGPLLSQPGGLRDGSVYVLGLRKIRQFFGARWVQYAQKVYEAMEYVIGNEIAPDDVYARVGTETYLIAFRIESEIGAGLKAANIARRVKQTLFGERSDLEMEVHALGRRGEAGSASHEMVLAALGQPLPEPSAPQQQETPAAQTPSDFLFLPIWDAYHKILSTYACLPTGMTRSGRMRFGHELVAPDASDVEHAEFDRETFTYLIDILADLHRNHFAVLVTFAVHYASLGSARSRDSLLNAFRKLPLHLKSMITLQIAHAPEDAATSTLSERVAMVRPYFRGVTYQISQLDQDVMRFAYMGLHGLLYRLGEAEKDKALDPDQIAGLIRAARSVRLQFAFGGVPDLKVAKMLADAGATYLSGSFLGPAVDMPANMRRCTLEDLGRAQN